MTFSWGLWYIVFPYTLRHMIFPIYAMKLMLEFIFVPKLKSMIWILKKLHVTYLDFLLFATLSMLMMLLSTHWNTMFRDVVSVDACKISMTMWATLKVTNAHRLCGDVMKSKACKCTWIQWRCCERVKVCKCARIMWRCCEHQNL
jgi:hypothetical protein